MGGYAELVRGGLCFFDTVSVVDSIAVVDVVDGLCTKMKRNSLPINNVKICSNSDDTVIDPNGGFRLSRLAPIESDIVIPKMLNEQRHLRGIFIYLVHRHRISISSTDRVICRKENDTTNS